MLIYEPKPFIFILLILVPRSRPPWWPSSPNCFVDIRKGAKIPGRSLVEKHVGRKWSSLIGCRKWRHSMPRAFVDKAAAITRLISEFMTEVIQVHSVINSNLSDEEPSNQSNVSNYCYLGHKLWYQTSDTVFGPMEACNSCKKNTNPAPVLINCLIKNLITDILKKRTKLEVMVHSHLARNNFFPMFLAMYTIATLKRLSMNLPLGSLTMNTFQYDKAT